MAGVEALVPGVSAVTRYVRYYGLYWALAGHAADHGLGDEATRRLVRRAEVCLAAVSLTLDDVEGRPGMAHGVDQVRKLGVSGADPLAAAHDGTGSYSPRSWGFWSQYSGPCAVLGIVERDRLRPGRHACPTDVRAMFAPLLEVATQEVPDINGVMDMPELALQYDELTADAAALAGVMTATRAGQHDPQEWTGDDCTRRATLRILGRSLQLKPQAETWVEAFRSAVTYGSAAREDPLLLGEQRTQAWRGLLLRHQSVGAWRRLWALLVDRVLEVGRASQDDLRDWIADLIPDVAVAEFDASLPDVVDGAGDPLPAEEQAAGLGDVVAEVAVLLLGARRLDSIDGMARTTFLGRRSGGSAHFLDPLWVQHLRIEFSGRRLRLLGRRLVDDMLAQSRRVALRKVQFNRDGTMTMFSRLHERNGWYFASSPEGRDNIGLRIAQLGDLAQQSGLFGVDEPVTAAGQALLELP